MNVLLVVPWDQEFGGVASVVGNLGRHLSNAGHHVVFFHPGADLKEFTHLVETFRPDIINWWSMWGLSKTLLPLPPAWGIPDVHWVEHYWMIEDYGRGSVDPSLFWTRLWDGEWGPRALRPLLRLTGRWWERRTARRGWPTRALPNRPRHVCFVSEHLRALHRAAGLEFPASEVIHGGVPPEAFYEAASARRRDSARLRVVYAGQITHDRGLHTVIEALGLVAPDIRDQIVLSVVGAGSAEYLEHIKTRVEELRLGNCVTFHGKMPHEQMPQIYKSHDVLVFPSIRDEGLPLTMVEAMLAGCAVATTGSGGAMEVATAAELPLFEKEDAVALSRIVARFVGQPDEVARVAARGQRAALSDFSFDHMMQRWLATLQRLHHTALHGHRGAGHRRYRGGPPGERLSADERPPGGAMGSGVRRGGVRRRQPWPAPVARRASRGVLPPG